MNAYKGDTFVTNNYNNKATSFYSDSDRAYTMFCSNLMLSRNMADFNHRVADIVNEMQCSDFVFRRVDDIEHQFALLTTMPDELIRVYTEQCFHESDLMIAYAKHNTQPIFASQVYKYICDAPFETQLTTANRGIEKLNSRFGFHDFYSVPMSAYNNAGNVLLAVTQKGMDAGEFQASIDSYQSVFRQLCRAIDYVITVRFARSMALDGSCHGVSITPKPLYILSRLANTDLTIAELAQELCISPITAHQHIAGARKALGVKTNIGAIRKAIKLKLIAFH